MFRPAKQEMRLRSHGAWNPLELPQSWLNGNSGVAIFFLFGATTHPKFNSEFSPGKVTSKKLIAGYPPMVYLILAQPFRAMK